MNIFYLYNTTNYVRQRIRFCIEAANTIELFLLLTTAKLITA